MKKLLQLWLKYSSRLILAKYQPEIIGITGSVGKTSAKEAITTVLSGHFRIRANRKNYNNEIGLPLTIIDADSPNKSLLGWLAVLVKILKLLLFKNKNYPQILVLEMGVDRPGDMDYFNTFLKPKIAILTLVGSAHLEFFGSREAIAKEKSKIFNNLQSGGWAVLNQDDEFTEEISQTVKHQVLTFGFNKKAEVAANDIICAFQDSQDINSLAGINFKLKYKEAYIPILLPGVISYAAIYAALIAAAVGFIYQLNGIIIADSLKNFQPPPGRMNLLPGLNHSMIIDDTYNASPQSALAALEIVEQIKINIIKNKWLVLGDMLELGKGSEAGHLIVGRKCAAIDHAHLLTIGQEAKNIAQGAREQGLAEERIKHFEQPTDLIDYLKTHVQTGDLVLVKGSQGLRLEKIVKAIMAEPDQAKKLLVRQEESWQA